MKKNYQKVQGLLAIILVLNLLVATVKTVLGYLIRSSSMLADGIHSFSDGASNVVGLLGIQFAKKPEDAEHPYGHEKIEMLSSSLIGFLLLFLAGELLWKSWQELGQGLRPEVTPLSLLILFATLVLNIGISSYEEKKGKEWKSPILVSDAKHTKSDIYVSAGVFLSLLGMKLGLPAYVDAAMTLVVAGFICHAAWEILRDNVGVLLDSQVLDAKEIRGFVLAKWPEVKQIHKIRSRGSMAHVYLDFHILVDKEMSVWEAHRLSHEIEKGLKEYFETEVQVLVHVEPYREACVVGK